MQAFRVAAQTQVLMTAPGGHRTNQPPPQISPYPPARCTRGGRCQVSATTEELLQACFPRRQNHISLLWRSREGWRRVCEILLPSTRSPLCGRLRLGTPRRATRAQATSASVRRRSIVSQAERYDVLVLGSGEGG